MKYTVYTHFLKRSDSKKKKGDQKQKQKTGNTHHLRHHRWNHGQLSPLDVLSCHPQAL